MKLCLGGIGEVCEDVNECLQQDFCQFNGNCSNLIGSFNCSCDYPAYVGGIGSTCEDNDECLDLGDEICGANDTYTSCSNTHGGFLCECSDGFRSNVSEPCTNVDECSEQQLLNLCGVNSTSCDDVVGSYQCNCIKGFNASEGSVCEDVNECWSISCDGRGVCMNTIGFFYCDCFSGYRLETETGFCNDVNECDFVNCGRDERASCVNSNGSYFCDCSAEGIWNGDGFQCQCEYTNFFHNIQIQETSKVKVKIYMHTSRAFRT